MAAPTAASSEATAPWWNAPRSAPFDASRLSRSLPRIHVEGNHFVNEAGATVVFQGVNIADPDNLIRNGHWNQELFDAIASWGANIVRVPVHPAAFRGRGAASYFELLDQSHPYPQKTKPPYAAKWEERFGFVAAKYPLIATEIGYMPPDAKGAHVPANYTPTAAGAYFRGVMSKRAGKSD